MSQGLPALDAVASAGEMHGRYFLTREILQRIELVRHLLENTAIVPLLVGPHGAGKSTLADLLASHAPRHWLVCHLDATDAGDAAAVLASLGEQLGLSDKQPTPDVLTARLDGVVRQGRVPVLLVDEAQFLGEDALALLLRLADHKVAGRSLLKIVLLAQEGPAEASPMLDVVAQGAARFQRMEIPRFSFVQAQTFIQARYPGQGVEAFSGQRFERLYADSGGRPGELIRRLGMLSKAPVGSVPKPRFPLRPAWLFGALALLLAIGLLLWFQQDINRYVEGAADTPISAGPTPTSPPLVDDMDMDADVNGQSYAQQVAPPASSPVVGDSTPEAVVRQDEAATLSPESEPASSPPPRDIVDILLEEGAEDESSPPQAEEVLTSAGVAAPLPESEPESPVGSPVPVADPQVPGMAVERPAGSAPAVSAERMEGAQADSGAGRGVAPDTVRSRVNDEDWLQDVPGSHYVLQLLGASRMPDVQRLARRHGLAVDDLHVLRVERKGRPWYVVLQGPYKNAGAARAALKRLPARLRRQGAWARRVASLRR